MDIPALKTVHLGLVCSDFELRHRLLRELATPQLTLHGFESLSEYRSSAPQRAPITGLLIDLETSLRASTEDKGFLRESMGRKFPILEFVEAPAPAAWAAFLRELVDSAADGRRHPRRRRILKAFARFEDRGPLRCFTTDLSEGGCFVVSTEDLQPGAELEIELPQLSNAVPARVVWARPWDSVDNQFPGFGLKFVSPSDQTKTEILRLVEADSAPR
jgi:hypothetical protein